MIKFSITLGVSMFFIGCNSPNAGEPFYFDKTFSGLWAETEWNYQFYRDGRFELECKGHYDFNSYPGRYFVLDSVIYLTPESDWQILDGVIKTRLKLTAGNCMRDNDSNFYCVSYDTLNHRLEGEYLWQEQIASTIDSLPEVIAEKNRVEQLKKEDYENINVRYHGIIMVKNTELHHFKLEKESAISSVGLLDFLVDRNLLKIYLHHSVRDSLSLVYDKGVKLNDR
jgi:hypothetical protein